jgi:DNA-3-methyladenine glycosylase
MPLTPAQTNWKLLRRAFFNRDPRDASRELLGKLIVRRQAGKILAGRVVEVEAYLGTDDLAAHAAAGRTARNSVLFGPPGHAYVYFIYGVHYCLNISCLPDGEAGCLLVRALEPVAGLQAMAKARGLQDHGLQDHGLHDHGLHDHEAQDLARSRVRDLRKLASGPGRLCEALAITRARDNGKDMLSPRSNLQVIDDGFRLDGDKIAVTRRIGITKSAEMPLRYVIAGNAFVSRR